MHVLKGVLVMHFSFNLKPTPSITSKAILSGPYFSSIVNEMNIYVAGVRWGIPEHDKTEYSEDKKFGEKVILKSGFDSKQ